MCVKTTLQTSIDQGTHLFYVADRQAGYFTAAQAKEAGYSYPNQSHHRKQGRRCLEPRLFALPQRAMRGR